MSTRADAERYRGWAAFRALVGDDVTEVQLRNPVSNRWVKVSTKTGRILSTKRTPGPYRNVARIEPSVAALTA